MFSYSPMVGMGHLESPTSRPPAACSTPELHPVESSGHESNVLPPASEAGMPPMHYHSLVWMGGAAPPASRVQAGCST